MPSPHTCMPLFTTWYALIPGIILSLTGGIRPYAPRHDVPAAIGGAKALKNRLIAPCIPPVHTNSHAIQPGQQVGQGVPLGPPARRA